jgi:hypothetical protein
MRSHPKENIFPVLIKDNFALRKRLKPITEIVSAQATGVFHFEYSYPKAIKQINIDGATMAA